MDNPNAQQDQPARTAPQQGPAAKHTGKIPKKIIAVVVVVIVIAIAAYFLLGNSPAQQASGPTLGSLLSMENTSSNIAMSYAGSAYVSSGNGITLPFTISLQRSGQNASLKMNVENSTLEMYKYGNTYYDCYMASNSVRSCYNLTAYVNNASTVALATSGILVQQVLGSVANTIASTSQRSYSGTQCTFFDVNINGTYLSGCISQASNLVMNISLSSSAPGASSTYTLGMTSLGRAQMSNAEFLNVTSSSQKGLSTTSQSLAFLNAYALSAPISAIDSLLLPEAAMGELSTFLLQGVNTSYAPQGCVAMTGFYCQNATYGSGTLTFTFGQATGSSWTNAAVHFVPAGSSLSSNSPSGTIGNVLSGQTVPVAIQIPPAVSGNSTGTALIGTLYATYNVSGVAQNAIEIGMLSVTAK